MSRFRNLLSACALLALGLSAVTARAEQHALLVGVSSYPTLDARLRLEGPRNDVQRMQQVLLQRGFQTSRISVLADGVTGAQSPTRDNIMQALQAKARAVGRGDTLFIYFAGHGSQQPADPKTPEGREEADGQHEIFLPIDVGRWDGKSGQVQNAIVDYELRKLVDEAIERGAFVWGVFDACHSASLVRSAGANPEVRYRHVSPGDLGVGAETLDKAAANAVRTRGAPTVEPGALGAAAATSNSGGQGLKAPSSVFFYAAQTTEQTPEMRLPQGDPQRMPYGLFSFTLAQALEQGQPMSYRQLGQYILSRYGSIQEARVTPLFAGNALDLQVFGTSTAVVRQWPVGPRQLKVPVGSLAGVAEGAVFAVVTSPERTSAEAFGYLKAVRVSLMSSDLEPMAHRDKEAPKPASFAAGTQARLLSSPARLTLTVAVDAADCGSPCAWQAVVDQLKAKGVTGADVQWVSSAPDLMLRLGPTEVVALPPSAQGRFACAGASCPDLPKGVRVLAHSGPAPVDVAASTERLSQAVHAMARATNLLRLSAKKQEESMNQQDLFVEVMQTPKDAAKSIRVGAETAPPLRPGDRLSFTVRNNGATAADVTLLYVDAKAGISPLFPSGAGEVNRLEPGAQRTIEADVTDNDGIGGHERLIVISVPGEKHLERADFSFLAQLPMQHMERTLTRGGPPSPEMQAFLDAAFATHRTRGVSAQPLSARVAMRVFTFDLKTP